MPHTFVVDGEIGSGKSTFIDRLCATPSVVKAVLGADAFVVPVLEPIEPWIKTGIFPLMCSDPPRWSAAFQHVAMVTRISVWTVAVQAHAGNPNAWLLLERAPPADRMIFTHVLAERKAISAAELDEHESWYNRMWDMRPAEIEHSGTLMCPRFEMAQERIRRRDRRGEDKYAWDYLNQLRTRYAEVVPSREWPLRDTNVMLDASRQFHVCDRELYIVFAQMCKQEPRHAHEFECTCH